MYLMKLPAVDCEVRLDYLYNMWLGFSDTTPLLFNIYINTIGYFVRI